MKIELESSDIEQIAQKVVEMVRPMLSSHQDTGKEAIMDKKGLSDYLQLDVSWIDKNLYQIPHWKAGKYVRFKQTKIDQWIENNMKYPSPYLKLMKNVR